MLYIVTDLFGRAADFIEGGAGAGDLILYSLALVFAFSDGNNISCIVTVLPVSLLAGALYSLSRLARHNELTALCASGVSLHRQMVPLLGVACACSVAAVAIQEQVGPAASLLVDRMLHQIAGKPSREGRAVSDLKFYNEATRHRWQIGRFDAGNPTHLIGVEIKTEEADRSYLSKVSAQRAEYRDGRWWLYGVREQRFLPGNQPDGAATPREEGPVLCNDTVLPEDLAFEASSQDRERHASTWAVWQHLRRSPETRRNAVNMRLVDVHNRFALPWACVVATLIAIPAGMRSGRQGAFTRILLAVGLFLAFSVLKEVAIFIGKRAWLAPWVAGWLANIVFFALGVVMIRRMRT